MKKNSSPVQVTIRPVGISVEAVTGDERMFLSHGILVGRIDGLTDEQRETVGELMKGYTDFLEGGHD